MLLHPDRLFPADPATRQIARTLYESVRALPIISPHGHTQARWFAENHAFPDPASVFVQSDHYVFRMLYSQGVTPETLEINQRVGQDARKVWRIFAEHYHLFRGTPTRMWLDYVFQELFGLEERLSATTADHYFDTITEKLQAPDFRPRALFEQFRIEALTTTDSPLDSLEHHQAIRDSGWSGRVLPTFRPDSVVDPDSPGFIDSISKLGHQTGEDTHSWSGYLRALQATRQRFRKLGCTATDHSHPTVRTADLPAVKAESLFRNVVTGVAGAEEKELFRAQMLTEMAAMSLQDGLVMQIHSGVVRNHNKALFERHGGDMGADVPMATEYVQNLRPLLDRFGNERDLTIILFTLDESTYSRELAPLAGHYPCLRLGPPWWFHDSPEGMMRFRRQTTETAGFYNCAGFNDDTRNFFSIPARHDMARRVDCAYLATLVCEHRMDESEAQEVAHDLAYGLAKRAYRL